jgi:LPXTG-motif cell wall-anchored protein
MARSRSGQGTTAGTSGTSADRNRTAGTSGRSAGNLPKTASELPAVGLIGLLALGGALVVRSRLV